MGRVMLRGYADRREAGRILGEQVRGHAGEEAVVLGLPRGGVPVAYEVAEALGAPLDVMLVRKLGVPGHEELAMGAIATGGIEVLNHELVAQLGISPAAIERVKQKEAQEIARRERAYRGSRPMPQLAGREVVLVDDGLATGATMRAAVLALRQHRPRRIVVAVPVAPPDTVQLLEEEADEVICPLTPELFLGVGNWYEDFRQVSDDEVRTLLRIVWRQGEGADD